MAARRSFVRPGVRRPKRLTQWGGMVDQGFVTVASGGSTLISSTAFEAPGTMVRARGSFSVKPSSYTADVTPVGAFGIGLVSAEALAIGITAVPTPYRDSDWGGWMVWKPFALHFESITQAGVLLGSWTFEIDSKAMRKVDANTAFVFVAESQSGAFSIAETVRLLLMLH